MNYLCRHNRRPDYCDDCIDEQMRHREVKFTRVNMIEKMMLRVAGPMIPMPEIPFSAGELDEYTDEVLKVSAALVDRFLEFRREELKQ